MVSPLICMPDKPGIVLLSGFSGVGKNTVWHAVSQKLSALRDSMATRRTVSCTTRPMRPRRPDDPRGPGMEVDGEDYFFISTRGFNSRIRKKAFAEYASVHGKHYYGTLWSQLEPQKGERLIVVEINYEGVARLSPELTKAGRDHRTVFIRPPVEDQDIIEATRRSLDESGSDDEEAKRQRMISVVSELDAATRYDINVRNDRASNDHGEAAAKHIIHSLFHTTL